jgi:hypothetical protein
MRKSRALLLAVVLYAMYVGVFTLGLPGIMAARAAGAGMGGGR